MKIEKLEKFITNLQEKNEYVIYIINFKRIFISQISFEKCSQSQ